MNKFFKNITLISLIFFNFKNIPCMDEQTTCKSEHTYPNLNLDGLPQEALINIVVQLLEEGETVKDSLDNVKNFFLTNKSINSELKEYFWDNIHKELFEIYGLLIEYIENINNIENTDDIICLLSPKSIINAIKILNDHSEKSSSLLFKIFVSKITNELLKLKEFKFGQKTGKIPNIFYFIPFSKDTNFLDLVIQKLHVKGEDFGDILNFARIFKNTPAIKLLVEKYKTKISIDHLFASIKQSDAETFNYLFKKSIYSQDVEKFKDFLTANNLHQTTISHNTTILHIALGNLDIFKILIDHIRSLNIDFIEKQELINLNIRPSLLDVAIMKTKIETIQYIFDNNDLIKLTENDILNTLKSRYLSYIENDQIKREIQELLLTQIELEKARLSAETEYEKFLNRCEIDTEKKGKRKYCCCNIM